MFKTKLTAAAVMAAVSAPLWAQTDSVDLGEVQVTGQRRYNAISTEKNRNYSAYSSTVGTKSPASPREIPQSISILTHQQIKDRNANTLDQLARKTSGLRVLSNDDGRSSIYARGYEYDEYNVDGLPAQMQSINGTLPNLAAFDRVEVMRGPSGLFDSSGEMGGIVNLVRKRPTKEFKGHIAAGGGTHKQYKLEGDVSGSLNADGSVRGRVLAQTTGKSAAPADKNNRSETAYAAVDWDITPDTTFGAGYLYQQRRLAPDNGLPALSGGTLLPLPQDRFVGAPWNKFRMNSHDVFADLKHYFDNGGYGKIGMRYSDRKADSNYAFSGSGIDAGGNVRATGLGTDIRQKAFAADASYSQPFEWGNTANEFVVGADYNRFKTDTEQGRGGLNPSLPYVSFDTLGHTDILANARSGARGYTHSTDKNTLDEMGLYGKLTVRPAATLSLIAGGRIGRYDIKSDNGEGRLKKNETKFTGYAGAVWDMTDNHSLYASYSSLFRPQANLGTDGRLLKARQGTQIETGYKGSYFDDRLNSRISLYRLQDKNAAAR
ncbi:TonB-dependent siderophore receptor, partial [Neisseria sp.]